MPPADRHSPPAESPASGFDWRAALAEHDRWLRLVVLARLGEAGRGRADAVEDVMQEVAVAAARGAGGLRDVSKAAAWLYRLAVTAALQHRRSAGRRRKLIDRYTQRTAISEDDPAAIDPLDWLLAEEQRQMLRGALAELPPRDAEVLLLKYTQDWSYAQLADQLGVSESAVEGRLQRARKKLRAALRRHEPWLAETR
ncbi:MAG: RNA polymerase sigma factor [Planctomycetota bacterium]